MEYNRVVEPWNEICELQICHNVFNLQALCIDSTSVKKQEKK